MSDILKEAFKSFELLEEKSFDVNDLDRKLGRKGDSLEDWVSSDIEKPIEIVDMGNDEENVMDKANEAVGELETGDYVLVCKNAACGRRISKHPDDEDIGEYVEGEKECPWCGETAGFFIESKVVPFKEKHDIKIKDDEVESEEDVDVEIEKEPEEKEKNESLKEGIENAYDEFDINDEDSLSGLNYNEEEGRLERRELEAYYRNWKAYSEGKPKTFASVDQWIYDRLNDLNDKQKEEIKTFVCDEDDINESLYTKSKKSLKEEKGKAEKVGEHKGVEIEKCTKCGKFKAKVNGEKIKGETKKEVEDKIDKLKDESLNEWFYYGYDYFIPVSSFEELQNKCKELNIENCPWDVAKDEESFNKCKELGKVFHLTADGKYLSIFPGNDECSGNWNLNNEKVSTDEFEEDHFKWCNEHKRNVETESLKEGIENMSLETEHDIINISTEKKDDEVNEEQMLAPIPEEEQDEIMNNLDNEGEEEEETFEEPEEIEEPEPLDTEPLEDDFEAEEIKEESFNRLSERYLRNTYTNVKSFNAKDVSYDNGKLIIEGIITFKSGRIKPTKFIFEKVSSRKYGPARVQYVKFKGMNESFSNSKNAFTLTGKVDKQNNFLCCELEYNYTAKDKLNESLKTIQGRIKL